MARRIRWQADDGGSPSWFSVIGPACDAAKVDRAEVKAGVRMMTTPLATLMADARALEIEEQFLTPLATTMENVRSQLEAL